MAAIVVISFTIGLVFFLAGAWPIAGFFGLDVLLIYYAFRANYRSGREFETVDVDPQTITLTRVDQNGRSETFDFNTYWTRVQLDEEPSGHTRLKLMLHGRAFQFGKFLSDDDRRGLARALDDELHARRMGRPG